MPRNAKKKRVRHNYKKQVIEARIIISAIGLSMPSYMVSNNKKLKEAIDRFIDETSDIII